MEQGLNNFQHYKNIHAIHPKNDIYLHLNRQEPDVSLSLTEHKIIYHRQTILHSNICCKQPSSILKTSKDAKNRSCFTAKHHTNAKKLLDKTAVNEEKFFF